MSIIDLPGSSVLGGGVGGAMWLGYAPAAPAPTPPGPPISPAIVFPNFPPPGSGIPVLPLPVRLVPLPDARTGLSQTGRLIDQVTKDYVFAPDGRLQGMPTVNQLVLLAIQNNIDLSTLTEKGKNFNQTLTTLVQNALADLITRKLVRLDAVVIAPSGPGINPDSGVAVAYWFDLTSGTPQQTPF